MWLGRVCALAGLLLLSGCGESQSDASAGDDESGGSGGTSGSAGSGATGGSGANGGAVATGGTGAIGGSGPSGGNSGTGGVPPSGDFPTGFGPPEAILTGLTFPVRLGIRDGYLYFTEMGLEDGSMSRLARRSPSGEVETLYSGNRVAAMHLDAEALYFVERGTNTVFRLNYYTLEREVFTTTTMTVADIETLAGRVWITEFQSSSSTSVTVYDTSGTIVAQPLPPTATSEIFAYMTVGGGNVYITRIGSALFKIPSSGAGRVTVSNVQPAQLAANDTHVYFTSQDGAVFRQLHTVDEQPEELSTGEAPFATAVDDGGAYWTNGGLDCESNGTGGSVYGVALAGGAPVPVATGERCPQAITTDGDYVYWTREAVEAPADDSIVRARKILP
jgi:hypothetical protein